MTVIYGDKPHQSDIEKDLLEIARLMRKHGWELISSRGEWTYVVEPKQYQGAFRQEDPA